MMMLIDEIAIPQEIDLYFKESLAALDEPAFILGCRKLPTLMEGLNHKSPNIKILRMRVLGILEGKSVPGPILELLHEATLRDRFFAVLSFPAIKHAGDDWASYFGFAPFVGSLLLDDRQEVRNFAREVWPRLSIKLNTAQESSGLTQKLGPFLRTLQDLIDGSGYQKPAPLPPLALPQKTKLSHDEEIKLIENSTLVKRLKREIKEGSMALDLLKSDYNQIMEREKKVATHLQSANAQLEALQRECENKVAQGISDALLHRLGAWVQPHALLIQQAQSPTSAIEKATEILKRQAQLDARYGTVSQLRAEKAEAIRLKEQLQIALNESLRPLPELQDSIRSLSVKINEIDEALKKGSIAPDTPRLQNVSEKINTARTLEEALAIKSAVTQRMTQEVWPHTESVKALDLLNRRILNLYEQYGPRNHLRQEDLDKIAPLQILRQSLIKGESCWILVDGHNLLHQIKSFIGLQYFDQSNVPNVPARELLIEKLKVLVDHHPNFNCDLWFDGPQCTHRTESERLKVFFSGGKGENRADARILESVHGLAYRGVNAKYIVVTDDRDLLKKSQDAKGVGMSPVEFWMGFLAT